jgi:hypothetical protein
MAAFIALLPGLFLILQVNIWTVELTAAIAGILYCFSITFFGA